MSKSIVRAPITYSLTDVEKKLSEIISRVAFTGDPAIITRDGKMDVVIISGADYERYRQYEDQVDGELATKRLSDNSPRYSSEEVKKELGL